MTAVDRIAEKLGEVAQRAHRERQARSSVSEPLSPNTDAESIQALQDRAYADSDERTELELEMREEKLAEERMWHDERRALRL